MGRKTLFPLDLKNSNSTQGFFSRSDCMLNTSKIFSYIKQKHKKYVLFPSQVSIKQSYIRVTLMYIGDIVW